MLDKAASSFTLLVAPAFMAMAIAAHHWQVVRSARALVAGQPIGQDAAPPGAPAQPHPTMVPVFIVMSFAMALVKIAALLTIRKQRWLTRDVEVSATTKRVVRTAEPAAASEARAS